jgi:hypothetical protein
LSRTPVPQRQRPGPRPLGSSVDEPLPVVEANDSRMNQVVFADGLLWSGLNTIVAPGPRDGIAFFIVKPTVSGGQVAGTIRNQSYLAVANGFLSFPSVGVNGSGRGVIAMSLMGPGHFPSAVQVDIDRGGVSGPVEIVRGASGRRTGSPAMRPSPVRALSAGGGTTAPRWPARTAPSTRRPSSSATTRVRCSPTGAPSSGHSSARQPEGAARDQTTLAAPVGGVERTRRKVRFALDRDPAAPWLAGGHDARNVLGTVEVDRDALTSSRRRSASGHGWWPDARRAGDRDASPAPSGGRLVARFPTRAMAASGMCGCCSCWDTCRFPRSGCSSLSVSLVTRLVGCCPPPYPADGGSAFQPAPLRRGGHDRSLQRPAAGADRPGYLDRRAAGRR